MPGAEPSAADRSRAAFALLPWAVLAAAAVVFGASAAAGPQLYDAGELAAAAVQLGASHPPGQPLHALLGKLFALLPLGPLPLRLSLLSAACALAAAWAGGRLCAELCAEAGVRDARLREAGAAAAALGLLVAPPLLRQALRIEVYTLALLLFVCAARELLHWARDARAAALWRAALLCGLCLLVHPPQALAGALTAACLCAVQPRRLLARPRVAAFALLAGLFPLLGLLYLPLRARAGAGMWGDPSTIEGLVRYVSGEAFLGNVADHDRLALLGEYGAYLLRVTGGVAPIGALLLIVPAARGARRAVAGMLIAALAVLLAACLQPLEARNPDNVAYLVPALALWAVTGAAGFAALADRGRHALGALGLLLLAISPAAARELPEHLRADVPALETLSASLTDTPPPRAFVMVTLDFTAAAWMMAQAVDGARPDAAVFVSGLSTSSWHWAQLRRHPAFDGRPRAARGTDAHDRYARGAVASALPHVSVALERELPGVPVTAIAGAYALLDVHGPPVEHGVQARAMGERWLPALARDARTGPGGDSGAAAAVVRDVFYQRSRRLLRLGRGREALAGAALALWDLPRRERALLRVRGAGTAGSVPVMVDDVATYLISREDAVRQAAAALWAMAEREAARALLERQLARGDPLAVLQLAHLLAWSGDAPAARRTLEQLARVAPELAPDIGALRARLTAAAAD